MLKSGLPEKMERAGRTIAKLRNLPGVETEQLALAAWTAAIGKRLAERAVASSLVRDRLIVNVADKIWQQQLYQLRAPILEKLAELLGGGVVNELEFRVRTPVAEIPRRPPRMAASLDSSQDGEEIADPVLRMLYRGAARKAR